MFFDKVSMPLNGRGSRQVAAATRCRMALRSLNALERLTVAFDTPAWLVHDKRLALDLDFLHLFRATWRRLSVLSALYGEPTAGDDDAFRRLDALAAEVTTVERHLRPLRWERRSDESGQRHRMEGIVGTISFAGPVGAFRSVIAGAELAHLGKSTSFGLGRVRATFVP